MAHKAYNTIWLFKEKVRSSCQRTITTNIQIKKRYSQQGEVKANKRYKMKYETILCGRKRRQEKGKKKKDKDRFPNRKQTPRWQI